MPNDFSCPRLGAVDIERFIADGFVRIDQAFPAELVGDCRAILWRATGCDPDDPASWTQPVIRIGHLPLPPFRAAANTPALHAAFDTLVGLGRWLPCGGLGTFPIRFPSPDDPGDAGWHIDVSFGYEAVDFMQWRANVHSKGRALLMLFLLSDIGEADAPTRLRPGSHLDIARRLAPHGEDGLTLGELAADGFDSARGHGEVLATGTAGTVYLCHPFLVHAAQPHRGTRPRFLAQPPLLPADELRIDREGGDFSPVERATRGALGLG